MSAFWEYIKSALASIKDNKGRSFLTMLGIIIGIASVLAILSVGDGMKAQVNSQVNDMGGGSVTISVNEKKTDKLITTEDIEALSDIPGLKGVNVSVSIWGYLSTHRGQYEASISGGSESQKLSYSGEMVKGRFFDKADVEASRGVIVLSEQAAKKLFGSTDVIGQTMTLASEWMSAETTVIGVRANTVTDTAYASYDYLCADVPYSWLADVFGLYSDGFSSISIYADAEDKDDVAADVKNILENRMGLRGENAVRIGNYASNMDSITGIMNVVTLVVALVAAISLIVGGIGVMNIMTVTVTERTREIGIRKALGARTSYIMVQFLAESAILTLTGGIIGIILGLIAGSVICRVADFPFVINPSSIITVTAISTAVGLFFGIYPARRAAALDPIEALRSE